MYDYWYLIYYTEHRFMRLRYFVLKKSFLKNTHIDRTVSGYFPRRCVDHHPLITRSKCRRRTILCFVNVISSSESRWAKNKNWYSLHRQEIWVKLTRFWAKELRNLVLFKGKINSICQNVIGCGFISFLNIGPLSQDIIVLIT